MSHNINDIKSQHELNDGKRKSDVLIEAIEKCEKLGKQLLIAKRALKYYAQQKHKLKIKNGVPFKDEYDDKTFQYENLYDKGCIITVENGIIAREALEKIKELNK